MREIFVDTSAWIALKYKGDALWSKAMHLHHSLLTAQTRYVTSNYVLDESYTLLRLRVGHYVALDLHNEVYASRLITIVHVSEVLEEEAWRIFVRYADKAFSFTDCTSFAIVQQRNIQEVFTNDHHFEQFGYQTLLK